MSSYSTTDVQVTSAVMRLGPPPGSRWRGFGRFGGLEMRRVPGAGDDLEAGAGDAGGDVGGAGAAGRVERAGDDEGRGGHLAESIAERLHDALSGPAQAGGETGRAVAQPRGVKPGDRAPVASRRGSRRPVRAPTRRRRPSIPSRSSRVARASSAAARAARAAGSAMPADGLSRTSRRTDRGCATARRRAIRAPSE